MFKSIMKAAVGIVTTPIDLLADVVTLGGTTTDQKESYTGKKLGQIMDNLSDAADPIED